MRRDVQRHFVEQTLGIDIRTLAEEKFRYVPPAPGNRPIQRRPLGFVPRLDRGTGGTEALHVRQIAPERRQVQGRSVAALADHGFHQVPVVA